MKLWNFLIMLFISVMMAFPLAYAKAEKKGLLDVSCGFGV